MYSDCLESTIKKNLSTDAFIVAGTSAWDASGVSLGHTTIFTMIWVYNHIKNGICDFEYGRIKFERKSGYGVKYEHLQDNVRSS